MVYKDYVLTHERNQDFSKGKKGLNQKLKHFCSKMLISQRAEETIATLVHHRRRLCIFMLGDFNR